MGRYSSNTVYKRRRSEVPKKGLPQKGRIRIILIGIISFAVVFVVLKKNKEQPKNQSSNPQTVIVKDTVPVVAAKTPPKINNTQKSQSIKKKEKAPKDLFTSIEDVKKSLEVAPPTLKTALDTVLWKGRKVVRHFSLDSSLIKVGNTYLTQYTPLYGGVVILQPRTGRVLALNSYAKPTNESEGIKALGDNLWSNAKIPAASLAKLVTATSAIEVAGLTPRDLIEFNGDRHTLYRKQLQKKLEKAQSLMLREAFAYSVNPAFGRLGLFKLGATNIYTYAQKYGFNTEIPFELPIENSHFKMAEGDVELAELASGFNESTTISPMLGALMAGAVSNKGVMIAPTLVDSIVDIASEEVVYKRKAVLWRRAAKNETSKKLIPLMEDVVKYGTAKSAFEKVTKSQRFDCFVYGGKTGRKDMDGYGSADWFIGFLKDSTDAKKDLACAVFLIQPPKWRIRSAYIAAEMMRNHIMTIQQQDALDEKSATLNKEQNNG